MRKTKLLLSGVILALCVAAIWAPILDDRFELDSSAPLKEQRELATLPEWDWEWDSIRKYSENLEAFYNDHFGFRRLLNRAYSGPLFNLFNSFPDPDMVELGRDDWLSQKQA